MEIEKTYIGKYFNKSAINLIKSKFIFFIISFFEVYEITISLLNQESAYFYLNKNDHDTRTKLIKFLINISPYNIYAKSKKNQDKSSYDPNYNLIIIYLVLLIFFYLYMFFGTKPIKNEIQGMQKLFDKIFINIYDFLIFRLLPLYGFDSIFRAIFNITAKDHLTIINIIVEIIIVCFFFCEIFTHILYFSNVCLWNNFYIINSYIHTYPYDIFFSRKYDIIMFILKIFISLNKAYIDFNFGYFNRISTFLTFLSNAIFYFYVIYIIYLFFFSNKSLYIYINFSNRLRIFYIIFIFECLILYMTFHDYEDNVPYVIYTVIFVIFNIYLIASKFDDYLYSNAVMSQNYLSVFWFILSNNIDRQDFTIEWIANHKSKCLLKSIDCPICSKLQKDIDIYSEDYLRSLNNESSGEFFLNLGKTKKTEFTKTEKRTMISHMFPPFTFYKALIDLVEKNKKSMTQKDLIRYDFIQLTILFQSDEKLIDFIIYNKIFYCIHKYQKNSPVLMTYILLYNLFGLSEKISKQKYEILQKNEELRNSLNKYLKDYEEFILYKEKTPVNYYEISNKYKDFKDLLITIHVYFKNNIECNYELILMRYIYEILVNAKFSHTQPFDLNTYSEFLEYHFSHSRILLLKYNIEKEVFLIIKGSKEMQKFQGKQFNCIFPRELRDEGSILLKTQLNNLNEDESKTVFEFVVENKIKDTKFIDSFKMNFAIYPTTLINELFIQANYKVGYMNLIIFESYNQDETLYSYSFQLYKFLGITPKDIQLLKNSGISFNFENLFKKRIIDTPENKEEKEKQKIEYIFSYRDYVSIYKRLIHLDIIKESQNYPQMADKLKQFETQSKEDKEIIFQINKRFECYTKLKTYNIYSIKEIKKKRFKKNNMTKGQRQSEYFERDYTDKGGFFEEDSENEGDENDGFDSNVDVFEGKGMTMAGSILSVSKASSVGESLRARGKKDEKMEEKKLKRQQLYKTVYIILGFGIMLIAISVIFLVLEDNENSKFKKLINLFYTFHIFKRGIESIPLTILSNYKYVVDDYYSENQFELYAKKLGEKYPLLSNPLLTDVLLKDSGLKLATVQQSFNNYLKELHSIEENLSNTITNLVGHSYKIEVHDYDIKLYNIPTSIITVGREYLNALSILLNQNSFLNDSFVLLSQGGQGSDGTSMIKRSSSGELSMTGKNMILTVLIYPFLHDGLIKISTFILEKSNDIVVKITKVYIIFFSILLILHAILLIIGMVFLIYFIKILKLSIEQGNKILEDKKFLEYLDKRLTQIKIMKNLYIEEPIKIMDKIESLDEMFKNKNKEEAKEKANNNNANNDLDLKQNTLGDDGNKSNDHLGKNSLTSNQSFKTTFKDDLKGILNDKDKASKELIDKEEFQSLSISPNISQKAMNKKLSFKEFYKITLVEFILLYFSFVLYFLYSIIMLIIIISGINKLYNLIDYMKYNDLYDAYCYDNIITYLYILDTNSTSNFYGSLTDNSYILDPNKDYIEENIELLYEAAKSKDNIEQYKESYFIPFAKVANFNCTSGIIQDEEMIEATKSLNTNFDKYFAELCKEYPVASTGVPINVMYEIVYMIGKLYRKYEQAPVFSIIFDNHLADDDLYYLLSLILVFFRFQRNIFYNKILMNEVNNIMNYFSNLIQLYLVFCIIFEFVIFLIFYYGIIQQVKKKDKLFNNFIESFKYD